MKIKLNESQKRVVETHSQSHWSRRDFMGLGLQSFAALTLSSHLLPRLAWAQDQELSLPAFLVIDLVGGAALPGNFLVGGTEGPEDLLPSYRTLGFDPRRSTLDRRFGLPAPADISQIFQGIITTASPEAQANFRMSSIAHQSIDDSNNNTSSALGHIAKYWDRKIKVRRGYGSQGTDSGGRTRLALNEAAFRPEQLTDILQLNLLKGLGYMNNEGLSDSEIKSLINIQSQQSENALKAMTSSNQTSFLKKIEELQKGILSSMENSAELDPRNIESIQQLFGIDQNTNGNDENVLSAGIINTALTGMSGPSCIALGGYDYHDNTQTTGDQKDLEAGQLIGRAIEMAYQNKKPLFLQILTDGSCSPRTDSRIWVADSGQRSLTLMGMYNPTGINQDKLQLGYYTHGEIAESETFVGRRTDNVAEAVLVNYLSAIDKLDEVETILPSLDTKTIDSLVSFVP